MNPVIELHRHRAASQARQKRMATVRPLEALLRLPRRVRCTTPDETTALERKREQAVGWIFRRWTAINARIRTLDTLLDLRRPDHPVAYVLTTMAGEASRHERWQQLLAVHSMDLDELCRLAWDPDTPESMARRAARELDRRREICQGSAPRAHRT